MLRVHKFKKNIEREKIKSPVIFSNFLNIIKIVCVIILDHYKRKN